MSIYDWIKTIPLVFSEVNYAYGSLILRTVWKITFLNIKAFPVSNQESVKKPSWVAILTCSFSYPSANFMGIFEIWEKLQLSFYLFYALLLS